MTATRVENVWLMRQGDDVVVLIEHGGRWYEAIREPANGNFSHNISAHGIASLYPPVQWLAEAAPQEGES